MWLQNAAGEFGKEALDEIDPGAALGSGSKFEAVRGLTGEPGCGLFGDIHGMVVEDQLDRRVGRIGGVEKLEEFDEFAAAMAILDQRMDLAGYEVDAGQLTVPWHAGLGRQVRGGRCDGLDTRFLVVRDDRHRVARLFFRHRRCLLQESHLTINAPHFGHLLGKLGIALFQVVSHFVRLHLILVEDLAHRALRQIGEACISPRRRERDGREARSSTICGDSRDPSPSGTPATPAMPWPPA
jgi:hypothetical protein